MTGPRLSFSDPGDAPTAAAPSATPLYDSWKASQSAPQDTTGGTASATPVYDQWKASQPQPSFLSRTYDKIRQGVSGMVAHPLDTMGNMATSAGDDLYRTLFVPTPGEVNNDIGNAYRMQAGLPGPIDTTKTGTQSTGELAQAGANTVLNAASVPLMEGGGFMAKLAKMAGLGALGGAVNNPGDPVSGGLAGAAMAVPLGAAGEGVARGGNALYERAVPNVVQKAGADAGLGRQASRYLASEGSLATPEDMAKATAPGGLPADAMPHVAQAVRDVAPETRSTIDDALNQRQIAQKQQLADELEQRTGVQRGTYTEDKQAAQDQLQQAAKPVYAQLAKQAVTEPDAVQALSDIATRGGDMDQVIAQTNKDYINAGKKPPRFLASEPGPATHTVDGTELPDFVRSNPSLMAQLEEQGKLAPAGQKLPKSVPLDYVDMWKRNLDDVIRSGVSPSGGKVNLSGIGGDEGLMAQRANLVGVADDAYPEYGQIRQQYADKYALDNAAKLATKDFKDPTVDGTAIKAHLDDMEPPVRDWYKRTVLQNMLQKLDFKGGLAGNTNFTRFFPEGVQDKLGALFNSPQDLESFQGRLKAMDQQSATRDYVSKGSTTVPRAEAVQRFSEGVDHASSPISAKGLSDVTTAIGSAVKMGNPSNFGEMIQRWGKRANASALRNTAQEVAPRLVDPNTTALLQKLADLQPQADATSAARLKGIRAIATALAARGAASASSSGHSPQ